MVIIIRTGIDMIVQNLKNHFSFGLITGGGMVRVGPGWFGVWSGHGSGKF